MQQQQQQKKDDEIVINLSEIFHALLRRWWILLLCLVVGVAGGFTVGKIVQKDSYTISATYIVSYSGSESNDSASTMTSEYTYVTKVLNNCVKQVSENKFFRAACAETDINKGFDETSPDYITDTMLAKYVSYDTNSTENTIMYVNVTTGEAELTYRIINAICGETYEDGVPHTFLSDYIKGHYNLTGLSSLEFSLINDLDMPTEPDEDSTVVKYTAIGGIGLLVVGILVLACIQIFSSMVKGEEDLVSRYQLPVLASVPNFEDKQLYKGEYSYGTEKK
jgi:capsular polysaccharide biosynthesis protein